MIHGVKDQPVDEHFTVTDKHDIFITGIDTTSGFIARVYNPSGSEVSSIVGVAFFELGDGNYKYRFIPNVNGIWYVVVVNALYFPAGKSDDIVVDDVSLSGVYDVVIKTLGLVHNNIYIDEAIYDDFGNMTSARVRIYSDAASVGSNSNVIESYLITADAQACGQFSYWQQVVIP